MFFMFVHQLPNGFDVAITSISNFWKVTTLGHLQDYIWVVGRVPMVQKVLLKAKHAPLWLCLLPDWDRWA